MRNKTISSANVFITIYAWAICYARLCLYSDSQQNFATGCFFFNMYYLGENRPSRYGVFMESLIYLTSISLPRYTGGIGVFLFFFNLSYNKFIYKTLAFLICLLVGPRITTYSVSSFANSSSIILLNSSFKVGSFSIFAFLFFSLF